jgi:hypothetical protein
MHTEAELLEQICLPSLRDAQNSDGGWGFHPESQSRVESTCWVVGALAGAAEFAEPADKERVDRGFRFLRSAQLPDGSWPAVSGDATGSWVTSLACCVLRLDSTATSAIASGLRWLCDDWPRDSSPWRRFLSKLSSHKAVVSTESAARGWGWTPQTSSWVEPTSFAILALEQAGEAVSAPIVSARRDLARSLLFDRMCPGGGWNCGNPSVYGVKGNALIVPTSFALIALRSSWGSLEISQSLKWLALSIREVQSASSLAVARICFAIHGHTLLEDLPAFADLYAKDQFLGNIQTLAWVSLAIRGSHDWLAPKVTKEDSTWRD